MRVPGDHTPLSRGRWITHRVLLTVMHIEVHTVHVSFQDEPAQPPWNVTWVPVTPEPHLKRGRSFTVFPLPALPLFGSLQFTFLREWVVFDYVLLQCIPYVMATVLENAELCDTVSQCANLRVRCMSLSDHYTCLYHNCTSEYVGIWVCGRAWRGSSGRISGRQGVGTDQWLHHRSYSRRRSWSECGVDSLKFLLWGLNLVRFEKISLNITP